MLTECVLSVSTLLRESSISIKVCMMVEVLVFGIHMPIDMLVLSISTFNVVLGMNWLNKYRVTIDAPT